MRKTGRGASMCGAARRKGTNRGYIARHIDLILLALEIVGAILDETPADSVRLLMANKHGRAQVASEEASVFI